MKNGSAEVPWAPWANELGVSFDPNSPAMQRAMDQVGVPAAAWLVWRDRGRFRNGGRCCYTVPALAQEPAWFNLALRVLSRRRGWRVRSRVYEGGMAHLVERTMRWRG